MQKEFLHYEEALLLKDFGFDERCLGYYSVDKETVLILSEVNANIAFDNGKIIKLKAPLYQQAFRFFREEKGLKCVIHPSFECYVIDSISIYNEFSDENEQLELNGLQFKDFETYEEAELNCLKKVIELTKKLKL